jgi:glutamyl-tRNA synthetase
MSRDELIERFSLDRVGKSAATFDYEKLIHLNGLYLRALPPDEYADRLVVYLREQGYDWHEDLVRKAAPLVQEKIATLGEFPGFARFFFERVPPEEPLEDGAVLPVAADVLAQVEPFEAATIEAALRQLADRLGLKPRQAFQPIRLALTGSKVSPGLFESLELLGRDESIARISAPGSGFGGASGSSAR